MLSSKTKYNFRSVSVFSGKNLIVLNNDESIVGNVIVRKVYYPEETNIENDKVNFIKKLDSKTGKTRLKCIKVIFYARASA